MVTRIPKNATQLYFRYESSLRNSRDESSRNKIY